MEAETRTCAKCKDRFTIDPEDFDFYANINVPPPTWCPECRNQRRMAWREERVLYRGTCALCGKAIVTIHAPGGPFTIYCRECYKSDKWDATSYGRDYDFNKPFFKQYRELLEAVPRPALTGQNLINSPFTHGCLNVKNCYYLFWSYFSENSGNCYGLLLSKNAYDCYLVDNSDSVYESLHCNRMYKVRFGYFSDECLDSAFLYNCLGCSDCFGCVNLRKQKYCIFNEKCSKEEYLAKIKEWDLGSYKKMQEAKEKFRALYFAVPHRFAHVISSEDVSGDIIRDTKDCKNCFVALDGVQHCKYLYAGGLNLKDSMDVSAGGDTSELLYEVYGVTGQASRCFFSIGGGNCRDTWYSDWADNSSNVFGCVSLRNKRYCILNKQYSQQEYEALVPKIKQHMDEMPYIDKKGRVYKFGEFFPTELSAYAYNESFAFTWYPRTLTKDEVLAEGWRWQEPVARSYEITIKPENLPDHICDAADSICNETIGCLHAGTCNELCTTAFRISPEELAFYRAMNVALPRLCPNCRHTERLQWRNRFHLWKRQCMNAPCTNTFETTFAPEQPEVVYCDRCYKEKFF